MAIAKKKEQEYIIEVKRAKEFKSGDIGLDMVVNGVSIYNCIYKSGTSKKTGKDYALIQFPSRKGSDDKYYNYVYFPISDDMMSDLEKQIESVL